jgi:hypothetical protein
MSPPKPSLDEATLDHLRGLGRLLDGAIEIPGTRIRVGLDPLIGLVPVVGDWVGGVLAGYIVIRAAGLGASGATLLRMLGNLAIDALVGTIPVLGDIFDLTFRANERNLRLLDAHVKAPARQGRADLMVVLGVTLAVLGIVVGMIVLAGWIAAQILSALLG